MRELVRRYIDRELSRRGFLEGLSGLGFSMAAAQAIAEPLAEQADDNTQESPGVVEGTGGELLIAQARAAGIEYLFTNPGSYESGIFDAVIDRPDMQLIVGLHEGLVVAMADGYHRASGKPGFVNVHVLAGTAQMLGQLRNAHWDGSALVVTAGLRQNEIWSDEVPLAAPPGFTQREIARPFTKMCWEALDGRSIPMMLRRALKVAMTEPGGPVYLAVLHSELDKRGLRAQVLPPERFLLRGRIRPPADSVERAARMLIESQRPLLVAGDEVTKAGAQAELVAISEQLGLPVASQVPVQSEMAAMGLAMDSPFRAFYNFPARHPHHLGNYRANAEWVKRGVDLVVCVGSRDFGDRSEALAADAPPEARIVRIGIDTAAMGRNYPTDLALVGDVKETLRDLRDAVASLITKPQLASIAAERSAEVRRLTADARAAAEAAGRRNFGQSPIHPDEISATMAQVLDRDAILVAENPTAKFEPFNFGFRDDQHLYLGTGGIVLGWGLGAATGAKLGAPGRQVVCFIGDGSLMYSAAGFWTQARYGIPVLTVVSNNRNYQIVRFVYDAFKGRMAASGRYAATYLGDPDIDFVKLAESQGVKGEKVETADQLASALRRGTAITRGGKPYLVEVATARYGPGADSVWHEDFNLAARAKARG